MDDHTVAVDTAQTPTALAFAEVFNVAVPFIDRHLAGRTRRRGGDPRYSRAT